ncbi:hypothetical protein [Geminicoccus flavidas]|uniref:hypothetical protein n=1 Tax=Geminicoccus flavidas TaxID=2506407 RepID=UPI0013578B04|nr:hypothetical protein [Geminicoccus flavidas]
MVVFHEELPIEAGSLQGIILRFDDFDTNGDSVLNGTDEGITFHGGLVINLGVALRAVAPYEVAIGQAMLLKLIGVSELTASDFGV